MYPKKTPKQAREEAESKKMLTLQQREQLKAAVSQKLHNKYPHKNAESLQGKIDNFFTSNNALTVENLKELDRQVANSEKGSQAGAYADRDDISIASGVSKMSGATDFLADKLDETGRKKDGTIIDLLPKTRTLNTKKYKNEEEEWADIYKYNNQVYKAEAELEQDRKAYAKQKFKKELDEQVEDKTFKKQIEKDMVHVDYAQVMKKVRKEDLKDQKKAEIVQAKIQLEKQMRDKQIKENKAHRKAELKEERELDKMMIRRIQQEVQEEERQLKKKKEEDYAHYRKVLLDNEENRKIMLEELKKEKAEEVRQIAEQNRLVEEREKAREIEAKEKDARIRNAIIAGKDLIGRPKDDRERRQEMKVKKWADKKLQEDIEAEQREKYEAHKKKLDSRAYYDEQIREKNERKIIEKAEKDEQAKIWQNSTEKFGEYEKAKEEARKQQMKAYAEVLKKQMNEKFEERRVYDRLFDLRATQHENKFKATATSTS